MVITGGSEVYNYYGFIGYDSTANGLVTVTGENSLWQDSNELYVGFFGQGELTISGGGKVISSLGGYIGSGIMWYLGSHEDANDLPSQLNSIGRVTVTGQNSLWQNDGNLFVGACGQGGLTILDGGTVTSYYTWIGLNPDLSELDPNIPSFDSTGVGTVSVNGAGSLMQISDGLIVGALGGQGELTVSDGGTVRSASGYIGGFDPNLPGALALDPAGIGRVTVTGSDSLWQTDSLYVGVWGQGQLNVFDGGLVDANSVFVGSTGTITGNGTIKTELLTNSGTIKPGSSIGTLTIDGDLKMESTSVLEIEVDNSGNSDKLVVTGDANVAGGTVRAISTETITGYRSYTILEANSVTGAFNSLDSALLNTSMLRTDTWFGLTASSISFTVWPAMQFNDPSIGITNNQKVVGGALQQIANGGGNTITTKIQGLDTIGQIRNAYDQLCGQTRLPLAPISVADSSKFLAMPANRLGDLQAGLSGISAGRQLFAMAGPDSRFGGGTVYDTSPPGYLFALGNGTRHLSGQKWGAWGKGYGLVGDRETENGVPGYQYALYGAGFGLDYQFTEELLLGITGGYSNSDVDHFSSRDTSNICGKHIGLYGTTEMEAWYFNSILTYSYLEYQTQRYVDLTGERLDGDFGGYAATGYFEAGFNWLWSDDSLIRPSAAFQVSYLNLDSYTESGGSSSLAYDGQVYHSYKGSLGVRLTPDLSRTPQGRSPLIELRGRWVHEFGDVKSSLPAHFASGPGAVFTISDESISRDSAVLVVS